MKLPSFDKFVDSLTQEKIEYISGVGADVPSFSGDIASSDGFTNFCAFLNGMTFGASLRLLECYHEWLSAQIG